MRILKCKICGGSVLKTSDGYVCDSCGTPVSAFDMTDDRKIESMNRANEARRNFDYDEAIRAYSQLLAGDPDNAEINWNLALSEFGIEYETERNAAGRIIFKPTIHRLRYESFDKDPYYRKAMMEADDTAIAYYMNEGQVLSKIQAKLMELVRTEQDYDVFISFKAEDGMGQRTRDSLIAQQIYEQLTARGIRTFFSRISLQDVAGEEYEPHIFAALNSAKVMILVGTDLGYLNYGWVKNEWTRFLDLMKADPGKTLIPVYENLPIEMFPERIPKREAVDMAKRDAMLELIHGVSMLVGKQDRRDSDDASRLLVQEAQQALTAGNFAQVVAKAEKASELSPSNGEAWFLLFMAENHAAQTEALLQKPINWMESRYFDRAYELSKGMRRQLLDDVKAAYEREQIRLRNDANAQAEAELAAENSANKVKQARALMGAGKFSQAYEILNDNIVLSGEVYDLRTDCELGMEYENVPKFSYLYEELSKKDPAAVQEMELALKQAAKKKTPMDNIVDFGDSDPTLRMVSSAGLMIAFVLLAISSRFNGAGLLLTFKVVGALLALAGMYALTYCFANLYAVKRGKKMGILPFIIISTILFSVVSSVISSIPVLAVLLMVLLGLILWQAVNDRNSSRIAANSKVTAIYRSRLESSERELISLYTDRYKKLADYTEVTALTPVIDYLYKVSQ